MSNITLVVRHLGLSGWSDIKIFELTTFNTIIPQTTNQRIVYQESSMIVNPYFKDSYAFSDSLFQGFPISRIPYFKQMHLVIHMHPTWYPTDLAQVLLIGTLLTRTTLAWFLLLLEKLSCLVEDFEGFTKVINRFKGCNKEIVLPRLMCPKFHQLACDIPKMKKH